MSIFSDDIFTPDPLASVIEEKTIQLKEGERRRVSILFADLKGFTQMSEKLDPEFVQTTIDKIMRVFTQVIKNHGGYVDKYSGDEVMALFGAKVASEVDTERAIRAGLQMLENLNKFNQYMKSHKEYRAIDKPLAIRIGINTGLVTTGKIGEGREGDFTVYGDAVNLASRLESNAPVNSIMVPETIEEMLKDQFEYSDMGSIIVKGKSEPVSVFTVNEIKKTASVFHAKYKTAFIGRDEELKYLLSIYKDVTKNIGSKESFSTMVGIKADAGIGKTRLIHEFINNILPKGMNSNYVIIGRATNLTRQPYLVFISLLRSYFQLSEVDGISMVKKRIREKYLELGEYLDSNEKKVLNGTKSVIAFLLGIPSEDIRLKTTGKELQTHIHIALLQLFKLMTLRCNQSSIPMMFVLEDLHWIDNLSLDTLHFLIQEFNELDSNIEFTNIFLFDYRQTFEFKEEMKLNKTCNELELSSLSDDHSREMILQAFHLDILPENEIKNISKISGGNPFYIEEWIAYINTHQKAHNLSIDEIVKKYPVPTSLNALILSRVDLLDENSKRVLQSAAVMGIQFYASILQSLHGKLKTGINITDALKEFIDKDLIYKGTAGQYSFKHIISRDVIYEAILNSNRKMLHREIGFLLEDSFTKNQDLFYYDLAEHFDKAEQYEKAVVYLEKAGSKARGLFDNNNAAEYYQKLIYILENPDYTDNVLNLQKQKWKTRNKEEKNKLTAFISFQSDLGELYAVTGKWDYAENIYKSIFPAVKAVNDPLCLARFSNQYGHVFHLKGDFNKSTDWLNKGIQISRGQSVQPEYEDVLIEGLSLLGSLYIDDGHLDNAENVFLELNKLISKKEDPMSLTQLNGQLGVLYLRQGKMSESYAHFEKQFSKCRKYGYKNQSVRALANMGVINNIQGDFKKAIKLFSKVIQIAEEMGDRRVAGQMYGNLGLAYFQMHNYDLALKYMHTLLSISTKLNDKNSMISVNNNIGYTHFELGSYEKAIQHCLDSIKINKDVGIPESEAQSYDNLGRIYFDLGDFVNSEKNFHKSLKVFKKLGNERGIAIAEGGLGEVYLENNKLADAKKYFTNALKVFEKIKDQPKLIRFYLKRAVCLQMLKEYDVVSEDLNKTEEIANNLNDKSFIFEVRLYSILNDYYKEIITISMTEKALKDLDNKTLRNADKAFLYYQLWLLKGSSNYKKKSCKLYEKLFKLKPSYLYKKHLDLLQ